MTDIVERLRKVPKPEGRFWYEELMVKAADEIERLREIRMEDARLYVDMCDRCNKAREAARRFLRIFANAEQTERAIEEYPWLEENDDQT